VITVLKLALKVMAGDTIEISAKTFYNMDDEQPGKNVNIAPIIGSDLADMTNPIGDIGSVITENGQLANNIIALGTASKSPALPFSPPLEGLGEAFNLVQPKSGINFVLYNSGLDVVEENTGYLPVDDRINAIQNLTTDQLVMQEAGFIEIFVNNDAQTPVYYDNLMVVMRGGNAPEVNAYYPSGYIIDNLSTTNAALANFNAYKYNNKEWQKETNWLDYGARMMDPVVGRWWLPDPLAEKYYNISPYAYCLNNPNYIDPDGREPIDPRTGRPVSLNLNRASVYDVSYGRTQVLDRDLYRNASPFIPRQRGVPDGAWSGAAHFEHASVWENTSMGARTALGTIFPNTSSANGDYGSPNDKSWQNAANQGSYTYVDDRYAVSEVFRISQNSFNIVTVEENYITQSVNLTRTGGSEQYNINSVTTFSIEKGDVQSRTVKTWWGGTRTENYRTLDVTETRLKK
jgi:RHS repeat-associated protein